MSEALSIAFEIGEKYLFPTSQGKFTIVFLGKETIWVTDGGNGQQNLNAMSSHSASQMFY
ncbi:MAG: hypothetical protein F6J86_17085 [Symploca sp. SIO1B1]|nr:hypothetical protein [Symploca sp. SIO1B1]